jgi:hypothetical protein
MWQADVVSQPEVDIHFDQWATYIRRWCVKSYCVSVVEKSDVKSTSALLLCIACVQCGSEALVGDGNMWTLWELYSVFVMGTVWGEIEVTAKTSSLAIIIAEGKWDVGTQQGSF